ncbi:MAG TPA: heavy metal-binding domain-containing protein [Gaiellaceae bacterium]|jgi:uncharacterized protein YbjQ (UPF0145 family)
MLFGRKSVGAKPSEESADRAAESLRAVEAGGLPLSARDRLAKLGQAPPGFYTSDLTTAEFLLVREAGFRPVTQVMGSCFYNVGWQYMPGGYGFRGGQVFELDAPTQAWQEARRLALSRLAEEARLAGADAVVGVRINRGVYEWARGVVEFIAVGTAVKSERFDLGSDDGPVLSNLSGQDFAKLYMNGYWPVGIVAGTTIMYAMTGWQQQGSSGWMFSANQELPDFTRGVHAARQAAMQRVHAQAAQLGPPAGLVGMRFELATEEVERSTGSNTEVTDMIVIVHALGTAIVELENRSSSVPASLALSLNEEPR